MNFRLYFETLTFDITNPAIDEFDFCYSSLFISFHFWYIIIQVFQIVGPFLESIQQQNEIQNNIDFLHLNKDGVHQAPQGILCTPFILQLSRAVR